MILRPFFGFKANPKHVRIASLVRRPRRGAGVVDQDRLLSDCPGECRDRGFESHPLRQLFCQSRANIDRGVSL
jgi:hypothetical protein